MQIVSIDDKLHEFQNLLSGKNKKNISKCCLLKIFPRHIMFQAEDFLSFFFFFFVFFFFFSEK